MLDVCMTAAFRKDIIVQTLRSFKQKLFKDEPIRLIVNIDPVGRVDEAKETIPEIIRCLGSRDKVAVRTPKEPSFPKAFIWTWSFTQSPFVFHLEDDWELLREVDLDGMIALMAKYPNLAVLRLPYTPCSEVNKSWNKFLPWNGEFYEVPEDLRGLLGFAGHPSLIRWDFIKIALKMLSSERNPEKTLKWRVSSEGLGAMLQKFRYGVYGKPGDGPVVRDIGQSWRVENGWKKQGSQANFTVWEKVHST